MTSFQLQSSGGYVQGKYILCVCPLYNVNGKLIIQQFLQQGIKNWGLLLINDGSNDVITREYNLLKEQYNKEGRIVFLENKTHLGRAHCMNMGLELFHENTLFTHFTWLSCCDQYFPDYLVTIFSSFSANIQFVYTNFYEKLDGIKHAVANDCSYESKEDFLKNYTNIASPIWTRKAVDHIGKFDGSIQGYEGYDYLKRTFTLLPSNEIYYNNTVTMGCFCRQRLQYFKEGDAIEKLAKEKLAKEKLTKEKLAKEKLETNVLMCSHSNLAHTAGDTIMWSNWANHFMKNGKHVTLISKYPIPQVFLNNLQSKNYDIIVKKNDSEIVAEMDKLESEQGSIFIRNHEILDMLKNKPYLPKITFYGLDVHINGLSKMDNKFQKIITQSEQLKEKFIHAGIIESKIEIKEPLVFKYDFKLPERKDDEIRLIYCGTLRDEENILEIIDEFQKIHKERPEVVLKIVYGKINGNVEFTQKVNHYIKQGVNGITFKYNLSHKDACYEIATSDIGICWRKNGWGDNGEVSTKVKEYEMYGLQIINEKKHLIDYELLQSIYNFKYIKKDDLILLNNYYNLNKVQKFKLPINKKLKINFIIMNLSHITKTNGYVNNELRIMTGLSKEFDVYYNDVLINDCIVNNFLDIEKLNNKIIKKINLSNNSHFYKKYYGIFKNSIDYDATYFRCDNSDYIKQLFNNIKGTKIFSHAYDYNMWKNEIIGFQTFISEYMCKKNILKNYKDDNTLNYNQIQIIPEKTTVRPSFFCKTIKKSKKMDNNFNICVIGQINNLNNIIEDLIVIFKEIMMETNKKIVLYLLSQNDVKINNSFIKRKYFNEHKKYLEFISSCDLAISTWVTDVALYSNSNKVLDCISAGLPIIVPHSFSLYDILGKDYPLFYKSHNYKSDIKKCILYSINNSNIKYNIDIEKYNTDIISYYYNSIVKMKSEILLLGVSSGKRYYGGIATNIDNYLTTMKDYNFNVSGIMYDHYISDCVTYENGLKHVKQSNIYTNLMKVLNESKSEKIVIILFSWIHTDVFNFLKKYKNVYIILCNPGLFVDQIENFYLDSPINCKKSGIQFNTIERSDFVYFNSQMSYEIAKCGTNCKVLYYNTPTYFKYVPWFEKKYDVGFIVSNTKRSIKNFNFFKKILDNFNLNKISINLIIVGLEPESVKDFQKQYSEFNIIFDFNISNEKSIDYISKTKVILNTSFFDCGPTTLFEAILCNTKYVTSKNVGGIELLDNDEIVEDYKSIDEWCKVITTNLKNEPNRTNNILDKLSPKNLINDILQHVN